MFSPQASLILATVLLSAGLSPAQAIGPGDSSDIAALAKRFGDLRTVEVVISGMDYDAWKAFKAEVEKIRVVQSVTLRSITESVATIDVEYEFTNENLADRLGAVKDVKLKVTDTTSNRIKAKVAKD